MLKCNRAVVAEWVNQYLRSMGSNPGASILKFGLFLFSKWLCSDKNNNLFYLFLEVNFESHDFGSES